MKVIIDETKEKVNVATAPNYSSRRKYNQKNRTSYTKKDFEVAIALARLQQGTGVDDEVLKSLVKNGVAHLDNQELVPNGTEVMLNYSEIMSRKSDDFTPQFLTWVEEHKDQVFHLAREENAQSLVCFEEDVRFVELDGVKTEAPKWLFDLYFDILVQYNGEWIPVYQYDTVLGKKENAEEVENG